MFSSPDYTVDRSYIILHVYVMPLDFTDAGEKKKKKEKSNLLDISHYHRLVSEI